MRGKLSLFLQPTGDPRRHGRHQPHFAPRERGSPRPRRRLREAGLLRPREGHSAVRVRSYANGVKVQRGARPGPNPRLRRDLPSIGEGKVLLRRRLEDLQHAAHDHGHHRGR